MKSTSDESAKKLLEIRLKIVLTERDLVLLEQAINRYQRLNGQYPPGLEAIVGAGLLPALPVEPVGWPIPLRCQDRRGVEQRNDGAVDDDRTKKEPLIAVTVFGRGVNRMIS